MTSLETLEAHEPDLLLPSLDDTTTILHWLENQMQQAGTLH